MHAVGLRPVEDGRVDCGIFTFCVRLDTILLLMYSEPFQVTRDDIDLLDHFENCHSTAQHSTAQPTTPACQDQQGKYYKGYRMRKLGRYTWRRGQVTNATTVQRALTGEMNHPYNRRACVEAMRDM